MEQPADIQPGEFQFDHSQTIGALAAALAKAQAQMAGARKDSTNPHLRSKYADLASVWDACRVPLSSNGLCVSQPCGGTAEAPTVHTYLLHTSGEWMRGSLTMRPLKTDPQSIGSCITYARRYSLAAMVGVAPDDDDGHSASTAPTPIAGMVPNAPAPPQRPPNAPPPNGNPQSIALAQECLGLSQTLGLGPEDFTKALLSYYSRRDIWALTPDQLQDLQAKLRAALAARQQSTPRA